MNVTASTDYGRGISLPADKVFDAGPFSAGNGQVIRGTLSLNRADGLATAPGPSEAG